MVNALELMLANNGSKRQKKELQQELSGRIRNPQPVYDVHEVQQHEWMATVSFSCPLGAFKASGTFIGPKNVRLAVVSGPRNARLAAASALLKQLVSLDDDDLVLNVRIRQ
eukprot:gene16375-22577_t